MSERSKAWNIFRKRVAPLLMIVVVGLVTVRTCRAEAMKVEVVVDFGGAEREIRSVAVEYFREGEPDPVGNMRLSYGAGGAPGPAKQTLELDKGSYTAAIALETDAGVERVERRFRVEEEATIKFTVRPGD